jgi:hypothetical protein
LRLLDPSKVYRVTVTGHVLTYENGLLFDQNAQSGKPIAESKSAKK